MSSGPLTLAGGFYSWDFTNQLSKAYLNGQKQIATGIYGMIAGDCDAIDHSIADHGPIMDINPGKKGYSASDLNMDSQINNPDKDNFWEPNFGHYATIP